MSSYDFEVVDDSIMIGQIAKGNVRMPANVHVPSFVVTEDSILEGDGVKVVDKYKTEILNGVIYAKMDMLLTDNGKEPTYNGAVMGERVTLWQSQFGNAISAQNMIGVRTLNGMTLEEYKAYMVESLRDEKDDVNFKGVVVSDAKGEDRQYTINLVKSIELKSQIDDAIKSGSDVVATHDDSRTMHEAYTLAEAEELYKDFKLGIAKRAAYYDVFITRASLMETKLSIEALTDIVLTEEEESYVNMIAYEV